MRHGKPDRCGWAGSEPTMVAYHDEEWGVPVHDDRSLFEFLTLEGAQAGLSWSTILNKRSGYRVAFLNFDPASVAALPSIEVERLLTDPSIVRNRSKVASTVTNAQRLLDVASEFGSFADYIWGFVDHEPIQNSWTSGEELPAQTEVSNLMSKDLKARGFKFVGSTICYALMQATGMVNDHLTSCFRYQQLAGRSGEDKVL